MSGLEMPISPITGIPALIIRVAAGIISGVATWMILITPISFVFGAGGLLTTEDTFAMLILILGMLAFYPSILMFSFCMGSENNKDWEPGETRGKTTYHGGGHYTVGDHKPLAPNWIPPHKSGNYQGPKDGPQMPLPGKPPMPRFISSEQAQNIKGTPDTFTAKNPKPPPKKPKQ